MNATLLALLDTNCPDWAKTLLDIYSREDLVIFDLVYNYWYRNNEQPDWPSICKFAHARLNPTTFRAPRM